MDIKSESKYSYSDISDKIISEELLYPATKCYADSRFTEDQQNITVQSLDGQSTRNEMQILTDCRTSMACYYETTENSERVKQEENKTFENEAKMSATDTSDKATKGDIIFSVAKGKDMTDNAANMVARNNSHSSAKTNYISDSRAKRVKKQNNMKKGMESAIDIKAKFVLTENDKQNSSSSKCTMCYKNIQCKHTIPVKENNKRFQCDVCGEWFKHTYTLRKHKCNHEGKYICSICNKRYGLPSYLKRHMQVHSGEKKTYKCRYCDKFLCSTSSLAAHERLHTLDKPFECDVCHKTFAQSSNLSTHKLIHSKFKPFVCELCTKAFRHKQSLLVHLRSHTQERPYSCSICGKTFSQNTHMRTHERLHAGIKPYKCDFCEKTFSRKHHLGYHLETHSGKNYKCSICEKSFTSDRAVVQHERIHTGETPYKCDVCGKEFKYHGYLSVHKRIHTGDMPFKCEECPKEFIIASSLRQHLKHNHKTSQNQHLLSSAEKSKSQKHSSKKCQMTSVQNNRRGHCKNSASKQEKTENRAMKNCVKQNLKIRKHVSKTASKRNNKSKKNYNYLQLTK